MASAEIARHNGEREQKVNRLKKIKALGKDSPCPECEQPLGTHYDELVKSYTTAIDELENLLKIFNSKKEEAAKNIRETEKELEKILKEIRTLEGKQRDRENQQNNIIKTEKEIAGIKKELNDTKDKIDRLGEIIYDAAVHNKLEQEASALKKDYQRAIALEEKVKAIPETEEEISNLENEISNYNSKVEKLNEELKSIDYNAEAYNQLKNNRNEKEEKWNAAREKLNQTKAEKQNIDGERNTIQRDLDKDRELREKINEAITEQTIMERRRDFVGDYKEKVTKKELPEISKLATSLFERVTKSSYSNLRIKNDFELVVTRNDEEVGLGTLSGGEKDLASLCIRIAISKRNSTLAGRRNMGFLALDEVFGSLDSGRREELMNALNVKSKEFRQIFVVSHNEDVQEQFPNRIMISRKEGYSVAEAAFN